MNNLDTINSFVIQQKKEWGEILTGFETLNKYVVLNAEGQEIFVAAEESRSLLARWFLKALRPFTIHVLSRDGAELLRLDRPFRFFFHELNIYSPDGAHLGKIQKQFSILRRNYKVFDPSDQELFTLFGPILHPWTFNILKQEQEIGKITKKWSGLLKEGFTDADTFGVAFPGDLPLEQKCILLGAVFLIDFVHFENKGN